MEDGTLAYRQAARVLPPALRERALALNGADQGRAEELRLRLGAAMTVLLPGGERPLGGPAVDRDDLERLVELASRASLHTVLPQLSQGYLTVEGGHRLGLCGTAVCEGGKVCMLRDYTSAALRIARELPGVAGALSGALFEGEQLQSALILAPPGAGKTTLLRDLIRALSRGEGRPPLRVGVVDQRGELAAPADGVPQMDLGPRTDVLDGAPKAAGLLFLLRAMNPQVLAVDEVTAPEDVRALSEAHGCGTALLATAHGRGGEDLRRRPIYRRLLSEGIFRRLVTIDCKRGERAYRVEVLE